MFGYLKKIIFIGTAFSIVIFLYMIYHEYPVQKKSFSITNETKSIYAFIDEEIFGKNAPNIFWKIYLKAIKADTRLKSGDYVLSSDRISRAKIINILIKGSLMKKTDTLRFIEGWNLNEYREYLDKKLLRNDGLLESKILGDYSLEYDLLKKAPSNASLEGYLFPDTYEVFTDVNEYEIIRILLQNFDKKFTEEMRDELRKTNRSLHEVVILASILEKEVRTLESKKIVAGIFYNRLKIGMALQSDATINYITKSGRSRSTLDDLLVESPYNTYKYNGLPPGPISSPGLDSLIAALYPSDTPYFFFLTTDSGDIYFSKTFEQHVIYKQKYLK